MYTTTKHFKRNPLEICLLCFCCVIFIYLLNASKQIQERQEAIVHQYLTFGGYAVRKSFEQNPIISPDYIIWEAEEPFLAEEARLDTIIDVSIKQLDEGIIPEGAGEDAQPIPLGVKQREFVEKRLEEAAIRTTQITSQRMIAITAAKKERDKLLEDMITGRYRVLLSDLNSLFEMEGPFFFVYSPATDDFYTASTISPEMRFQVLRMLKTGHSVSNTAYLSLIALDDTVQLGAYMPANYNNPLVLSIIRQSIPLIVLILVFPCVICSFFTSSFLQAHKQKDLAFRIKRATHLIKDFDVFDEVGHKKKKQHKRYHDFRNDSAVEMAIYAAAGSRSALSAQGSLVDSAPLENPLAQGEQSPWANLEAFDKTASQKLEINTPRSILYGAHWVQNFLTMETTPIRKQLDRHTKIPNRTMFLQMLQELWIKKSYLHAPIFLAHIDVDDLEKANSLLGYTAGNIIINGIVEIVSKKLGNNGVIGRLSSDNFICLYVGNLEDFNIIIKEILVDINNMVFDGNAVHKPSASIGITDIRESDLNIDNGQRRALTALYQAKNDGKNCFRTA